MTVQTGNHRHSVVCLANWRGLTMMPCAALQKSHRHLANYETPKTITYAHVRAHSHDWPALQIPAGFVLRDPQDGLDHQALGLAERRDARCTSCVVALSAPARLSVGMVDVSNVFRIV